MRGFEPLTAQAASAAADKMEAQADIALAPRCGGGVTDSHAPDSDLERLRHQLVDEMQRVRSERTETQRRELQLDAEESREGSPK